MKKIIAWILPLLLTCLLLPPQLLAQGYGNGWINKGQSYYKLKVYKDGFYHVPYSALLSAGLNSNNPGQTQIFFRGKQINIKVFHPGSGSTFDTTDYIEFYGIHNDGVMDSAFYGNPSDQPQRSISFYTDTSVYFLTWQANSIYFRFSESQNNSTANTAPVDFNESATYYPNEKWWPGLPYDPTISYFMSEYWQGEGYLSGGILLNSTTHAAQSKTFIVQTPGYDKSAGNPYMNIPVYGESDQPNFSNDHGLFIEVKSAKAASFHDLVGSASSPLQYEGFTFKPTLTQLDTSDLNGGSISARVWSVPTSSQNIANQQAVAFVRVLYPRTFKSVVAPYAFTYQDNSGQSQTHFEFAGIKPSNKYFLYDIDNNTRNAGFISGGVVNFTVNATGKLTHYYIYDSATINFVSPAGKFMYDNSDPLVNNFDTNSGANYIIITERMHHDANGKSLLDASKDYAKYRQTTKFDSANYYKPVIFTVDMLYDMFYYGIQHHALAVKNFINWYYNKAVNKPKYVLFIGRGEDYSLLRTRGAYDKDFVPNIGNPPSELLYATSIDGNPQTLDPYMGIGRLSCHTYDSVELYLQKVQDYESLKPAAWRKNVIHVGGGDVPLAGQDSTTSVQYQIKQDLKRFQAIVQGPLTGCRVRAYYNSSQDVVNKTSAAVISAWINNPGAGLLTYYGHGSGTILGVPIGDPGPGKEIQDGPGMLGIPYARYPIMYMNGCNLGNPTYDGSDFIAYNQLFSKEDGAIIWMSHSAPTYTSSLTEQISNFYNNMVTRHYGATVGEIWRYTNFDFDSSNENTNQTLRNIAYTWVLQGDPAIHFPYEPIADYALTNSSLSIFPANAIANTQNITLKIHAYNYGRFTLQDSFSVQVVRTYPISGGVAATKTYTSPKKYGPIADDSIISFPLPFENGLNAQGNNSICVTLNYDHKVRETDYVNNTGCFQFYLNGNGIRQLYPADYSIAATDSPTLVVQSRNILDNSKAAFFEIDTCLKFNRQTGVMQAYIPAAPIMKWQVLKIMEHFGKNPAKDSVVFYWRARLDAPKGKGDEWNTRSFTYLPKSPDGWSQSHREQLGSITGNFVNIDTVARLFSFANRYAPITLSTHPIYKSGLGILDGNLSRTAGVCDSATMVIIQYDKISLQEKYPTGYFDCKGNARPYTQFDMLHDTGKVQGPVGSRKDFNAYIRSIPDGDYIALITRRARQDYSLFDTATLKTFSYYLGASDISLLHANAMYNTNTTYVLLARKSSKGGTAMAENYKYVDSPTTNTNTLGAQILKVDGFISAPQDSGLITSTVIGPSSKWKFAYQKFNHLERPDYDYVNTNVYGLDQNLKVLKLLYSFNNYSLALDTSRNFALQYPYLQFVTSLKDTLNHTPAQLHNWTVLYDGVPEGTLIADNTFSFSKALVNAGDSVGVKKLRFQNVSRYPFQKGLRTYSYIQDLNGQNKVIDSTIYPRSLQPDSSFNINKSLSTRGLDGNYTYNLFVNKNYVQPELTLDNNYLQENFTAVGDRINPILDVTFDGRHIMDGEIVSAKPVILITNKDENKTRLIIDTSTLKVSLKSPNSSAPQAVTFSSGQLTFSPATSASNNQAKIEYRPQNLADGTYELHVQAFDASGNAAGKNEYIITFQVINKPMVSNFFVYPNPFTTRAKFVFTLTGSQVPDYMKIQIMTITGRVVKEITRDELGMLRIGNNITDYAWDGKDEFGDVLANGLYMYRVVVKDGAGKQLDNYQTSADKYFSHNFGKLYILR